MPITIRKGSTYVLSTRWEQPNVIYVPITGVSNTAPAVITAPGHGLPEGWRFSVSGIKGGGSALNAKHSPPREKEYFLAKVTGADTLELNGVNGASWPAYISGGVLQFNEPTDFTDASAILQIRESTDRSAPILVELSTQANNIFIDPAGAVHALFSPSDTVALDVNKAYFDLEVTFWLGFLANTVIAYPKTEIIFTDEITK